jgi:hypothetical protein
MSFHHLKRPDLRNSVENTAFTYLATLDLLFMIFVSQSSSAVPKCKWLMSTTLKYLDMMSIKRIARDGKETYIAC